MGTTIRDIPILDLRQVSAHSIAKIDLVENVKTVVLSTENVEAFMEVPRVEVRSHLIIHPEETLFIGQIEFNDAFLEKLPPNTKLVILGHAMIDRFSISLFQERVKSYRHYGQIIYADEGCAGAVLARLERLQGQLLRMRPNSVRWIGTTNVTHDKLEALNGRPVLSIGPLKLDSGEPATEITDHISSMVQIGEVFGPEEAVCALFSVCDRRLGTIKVRVAAPEPAYSVAAT